MISRLAFKNSEETSDSNVKLCKEEDSNEFQLILIKQNNENEIQDKTFDNLNEVLIGKNKLKEVIAYSNGLRQIPNLMQCSSLQVLWLVDNQIVTIQGLESLYNLRELNLTKNLISSIGHGLENNTNLKHLSISGNPITKIEHISNLFLVKSLEQLKLSDPMFGDCPLVKNSKYYRLQMNYYMPFLREIDGFPVDKKETENMSNILCDYVMEYKNQIEQIQSTYRYKHKVITDLFHVQMAKFHMLQKKYKYDFVKNKTKLSESHLKILYHEIQNWHCCFRDYKSELDKKRQLDTTYCILNRESFGRKPFVLLKDPEISKRVYHVFQNFINCDLNSGKTLFDNVQINSITLLYKQNQDIFDHHEISKNQKFYLLKTQYGVSNTLLEWNTIVSRDFSPVNIMKNVHLTNCLVSSDIEYLKHGVRRDYKQKDKQESRVTILVGIPFEKDDLEEEQLPDHKEDCRSYLEFTVNDPDDIVYYGIEFEYKLKDRYKLLRDTTLMNADLKSSISEIGKSISYHMSHMCPSLTSITLTCCNISDVGNVKDEFRVVEILDLSFNNLTSITWVIDVFPNLRQLYVSHNQITQLRTAKSMDTLETLDISWNKLSSVFDLLKTVTGYMKYLKCLNIKFNSFEDMHNETYQSFLFKKLNLEMFNEENLNGKFNNFKSLEIVDKLNEDEITESIDSNAMEWKYNMTTLGIINNIQAKTKNHMIFLRNNDKLEGVCVKSTIPVIGITVKSQSITWISVINNSVSNLNILIPLQSLQEIYLSRNCLHEISIDFNLLPNLTILDLSYNYLSNLCSLRKASLVCLTYLNVSGNRITNINDFVHLKSLEQLYLGWNIIREDPTVIRGLQTLIRLRSIDIKGNPLEDFPNIKYLIVDEFPMIQFINGKRITSEDKKRAYDLSIKTLDYPYLLRTYSKIELSQLTKLTMSNVSLHVVQLDRTVLPNIESIDLERNRIEYMVGLCDLPKLKTLRLSYNKIKGLQEDLSDPKKAKIFTKLETLYLNHNDISKLSTFHFEKYPILRYLFLQVNKISDLEGLENAVKMRVLVLDKNDITNIPERFFSEHKNLDHIFLEWNKLEDINFINNMKSSLQRLYLGYNRIRDYKALEPLKQSKSLKEISLLGNFSSSKTEYYSKVIAYTSQVQYLDGHNIQYSTTE